MKGGGNGRASAVEETRQSAICHCGYCVSTAFCADSIEVMKTENNRTRNIRFDLTRRQILQRCAVVLVYAFIVQVPTFFLLCIPQGWSLLVNIDLSSLTRFWPLDSLPVIFASFAALSR